jgi:hypothetical protein
VRGYWGRSRRQAGAGVWRRSACFSQPAHATNGHTTQTDTQTYRQPYREVRFTPQHVTSRPLHHSTHWARSTHAPRLTTCAFLQTTNILHAVIHALYNHNARQISRPRFARAVHASETGLSEQRRREARTLTRRATRGLGGSSSESSPPPPPPPPPPPRSSLICM